LGLVVLVLVIASANSGGLANGVSNLHFGPTNAAPASWNDMATPITNFAGPITIDLTTLGPVNGADQTLRVHDVFGPIAVTLPASPSFRVLVRAHTSFGPVSLLGAERRGGGVFTTKTVEVNSTGRPTLNLDITDAFGPITVTQGASSSPSSPKPFPPSVPKPPTP
jgi:predicted membrane protein